MSEPSKAPMSETNESNTGIALAMMYAITVMPKVQPSQVIQCMGVLLVKCREPRRMWMKMNFAGICMRCKHVLVSSNALCLQTLRVKQWLQ